MTEELSPSANTARRSSARWKVVLGLSLAFASIFIAASPAAASSVKNWYGISCSSGYYIWLQSEANYLVTHTMRQSGSDPATNKQKQWDNGVFFPTRKWGYGYQTNSFAQIHTTGVFWTSSTGYTWGCS